MILWCHAIAQQLCLTDPANQCLIAAAQRHITSLKQQQQQQEQEQAASTREAWDAPAGAQHRHTDRAHLSGLMTSSDDSSNQSAQMETAQTATQPNSIGLEGAGVQTQGTNGEAGLSAHALHGLSAGQPMVESSECRMTDATRAPHEASGGAAHDDSDVVGTDAVITGGVGDDNTFTRVGLGPDAEEVHAEQLGSTDKADSCQYAVPSQAAGCDQQLQARQHPGVSQQPSTGQQASGRQNASRSQQQCNDIPRIADLQGRLGLQQSCQKMQVTLQVVFCFIPYLCASPQPGPVHFVMHIVQCTMYIVNTHASIPQRRVKTFWDSGHSKCIVGQGKACRKYVTGA